MPLSPRRTGFRQLDHHNSSETDVEAMDEIALQPVKSHSSATGARKAQATIAGMAGSHGFGGLDAIDEKGGDVGHHGRRKRMNTGVVRQDSGSSEDSVSLNAMGRLYAKIIGFSTITRYLIYVLPVGLLLAIPLIVLPLTGHKDDIHVGKKGDTLGPALFRLFLWIEISWLSLWAAKSIAWAFPHVFMFLCGIVSSGTRKYATVIKNLTIPFSLFIWGLVSWLVFKSLFNDSNRDGIVWVINLERILGALFVSSAVYLAEKAIVQLISITYHQRSFAMRIRESKREIHILGLLYDASRTLFPMYGPDFEEEDYLINDSIDILGSHKKGKNARSAPRRLIGDAARFGDKITSVFGNIASEITGKKVFNPNSAHSIVVHALEKGRTSEALARRIWMSFVVEHKEALYPDDIQEVLGPTLRDEADEAFSALDGDGNGDISLDEMVRKVVEMGKERKAINEGMKDISQAIGVFDKILLFLVLLIVIFIFLAFFQSSFITTLATAGTALLSLSFVFAVTAQEILGSCIFLFVKHPYDVADRVDIVNNGERMPLVVDKISLLYTVFTRIDKMQVVQIPNIQLNNLCVENVTRSKAMKEVVTIKVAFDTSFEDIELLRQEMENFVRHSDNSRDFQPDLGIGIGGVGNLDVLDLSVVIKHKSNWHNEAVRASRRSKFICALALALRKVPLYGPGGGGAALGSSDNPSYSVAVSDDFAVTARAKAADDMEAKRLVPSKPTDDAAAAEAQQDAANAFNKPHIATTVFDGFGYDQTQELRQQPPPSPSTNTAAGGANPNFGASIRGSIRSHSDLRESPSQGGRRKPGEAVSPAVLNGQPALTLSPSNLVVRSQNYDEEAQLADDGGLGRSSSKASAISGYAPYPQSSLAPTGQHQLHRP